MNNMSELIELPRKRIRLVTAFLVAAALAVSISLVWIQGVRGAEIAKEAHNVRAYEKVLFAKRGSIYDQNGRLLAMSVERYNVGVNQNKISQYRRTNTQGKVVATGAVAAAEQIAPLLGVDKKELGAKMVGTSTFEYIAKNLSPEQWAKISALNIPGVEPERISKRVYPNGNVAGNVLGFVNRDNAGAAGIEITMDKQISGKNGKITVEVDTRGVVIPTAQRVEDPASDGKDLQLTINLDLQNRLQELVDKMKNKTRSAWGAAVMIEVDTGRILALVDTDAVDPNNVSASNPKDRGARSVQSPITPGSTGKIITYGSAIDQGLVTPHSNFDVQSPMVMPDGERIFDADGYAPMRNMSVAGMLARSLNSGAVTVGSKMSVPTFYGYLKKFGVGEKTGVEIPGESSGILRNYKEWGRRDKYTAMFGDSYALTTIQLASIAQIVGNKGEYIQPHLIDGIMQKDGSLQAVKVPEKRRVISKKAAEEIMDCMEESVDPEGTARQARLDEYRVAAKSGTGDTAGPNSTTLNMTNATLAAIAPAENPKIAIGFMFHLPLYGKHGGAVAGTVFKEYGTYALQHLGVPYSTTKHEHIRWYND